MQALNILKLYTPVIVWSEEDRVWLASYPDLMGPNAHVHGDTPEEALSAIRECALTAIEWKLEKGQPIPPPRTIVSVPAPARYFENEADIEGMRRKFGISQSDFARVLGVSLSTYNKWATKARRPSGPSARLLQVAREHPEALGLATCR